MLFFNQYKDVGFFAVHGFLESGDISFGKLKHKLNKNKIPNFYAVDLQAHSEAENINDFNFTTCIERVEREYVAYKFKYAKIYLIGFSMGGVIASYLASKYGADKLVLISPAFKYGGTKRLTSGIINFFKNEKDSKSTMVEFLSSKLKQEEVDEFVKQYLNQDNGDDPDEKLLKLQFMKKLGKVKISVFTNFAKLVSFVRKNLKPIDIPTRIYHSETDELIPLEAAYFIFQHVIHGDKRLIITSQIEHRILASKQRESVMNEIIMFLYDKKKIR